MCFFSCIVLVHGVNEVYMTVIVGKYSMNYIGNCFLLVSSFSTVLDALMELCCVRWVHVLAFYVNLTP